MCDWNMIENCYLINNYCPIDNDTLNQIIKYKYLQNLKSFLQTTQHNFYINIDICNNDYYNEIINIVNNNEKIKCIIIMTDDFNEELFKINKNKIIIFSIKKESIFANKSFIKFLNDYNIYEIFVNNCLSNKDNYKTIINNVNRYSISNHFFKEEFEQLKVSKVERLSISGYNECVKIHIDSKRICEIIENNTNLTYLSIGSIFIEDIDNLINCLIKNKNIKHLSLISIENGYDLIPKLILNNNTIETLTLDDKKIENLDFIKDALINNTSIKKLNIISKNINNIDSLIEIIEKNHSLEEIYMIDTFKQQLENIKSNCKFKFYVDKCYDLK